MMSEKIELSKTVRERGPRIVVIGGGSGLSNMLRGLKKYTDNITAIVTVSDDGGNSGQLRQDLGMLPPGDIRNCILALSNTEPIMEKLIDYRFSEGILQGQNIGNLIIAALNDICGSFNSAIGRLSEVLAVTGHVTPVTNEDIVLEADFENGIKVRGETEILAYKKRTNSRICKVGLSPERPQPVRECIDAIAEANMVVFGPGSLYSSILPNLLVEGIVDAIDKSDALKVYVCNIMTQVGETEDYTAAEHVKVLFQHAERKIFDICLCNNTNVAQEIKNRYLQEGAEQIKVDCGEIEKMGVEVIFSPILSEGSEFARHDPKALAETLICLYYERSGRKCSLHNVDSAMIRYN